MMECCKCGFLASVSASQPTPTLLLLRKEINYFRPPLSVRNSAANYRAPLALDNLGLSAEAIWRIDRPATVLRSVRSETDNACFTAMQLAHFNNQFCLD